MNSTSEEYASKYWPFLLKWGIKTLKKKYWRMQSTLTDAIDAQLTRIWLRTVIAYPFKAPSVILKLTRRKDSRWVLLNKKMIKQLKPETLTLSAGVKIYINESLCPYYKNFWTKCRKLWDAKQILSFWVSNGSIRVKLVNENLSIITHDCDLVKLFPGHSLIADTN